MSVLGPAASLPITEGAAAGTTQGAAQAGGDIQITSKRRRLTMELIAKRALISRNAMARVERGDPAVSLGTRASVLFVPGLADRPGDLADPLNDVVGCRWKANASPGAGTAMERGLDVHIAWQGEALQVDCVRARSKGGEETSSADIHQFAKLSTSPGAVAPVWRASLPPGGIHNRMPAMRLRAGDVRRQTLSGTNAVTCPMLAVFLLAGRREKQRCAGRHYGHYPVHLRAPCCAIHALRPANIPLY